MSTTANLFLGKTGIGFNIDHDGYPRNVIPEIVKLAEEASKCKVDREIHFIGLLLKDLLVTGYGWVPGEMYADYEYKVDLEKGEASWIDEEKKVITVNYGSKIIRLWNEKKVSYSDPDELFSLLCDYVERYLKRKEIEQEFKRIRET